MRAHQAAFSLRWTGCTVAVQRTAFEKRDTAQLPTLIICWLPNIGSRRQLHDSRARNGVSEMCASVTAARAASHATRWATRVFEADVVPDSGAPDTYAESDGHLSKMCGVAESRTLSGELVLLVEPGRMHRCDTKQLGRATKRTGDDATTHSHHLLASTQHMRRPAPWSVRAKGCDRAAGECHRLAKERPCAPAGGPRNWSRRSAGPTRTNHANSHIRGRPSTARVLDDQSDCGSARKNVQLQHKAASSSDSE